MEAQCGRPQAGRGMRHGSIKRTASGFSRRGLSDLCIAVTRCPHSLVSTSERG